MSLNGGKFLTRLSSFKLTKLSYEKLAGEMERGKGVAVIILSVIKSRLVAETSRGVMVGATLIKTKWK